MSPLLSSALAALVLASFAATGCIAKKSDNDRRPGCEHRRPPAPPNVAATGSSYDLLFAVSSVEAGIASEDSQGQPRYRGIGFDLDMTCTGEGQGPSCVEPAWATADHTDGVDGIDNAYGQFWWQKGADSQMTMATSLVLMLRVVGYSGRPDDEQVEASLYMGRLAPRDDGLTGPFWDGSDRWNILPEMLASSSDTGVLSLDEPRFRDDSAYVSGGVLVAQFDQALWTPGLPLLVPLVPVRQVLLTGSLTPVAGGWELQNAVVGMRIGLNAALIVAAQIPDALTGMPTCQVEAGYLKVKNNICAILDISTVPGPSSLQCDAMSLGVLFQAKPATFGAILEPTPPLANALACAPGIHPETDTCDTSTHD